MYKDNKNNLVGQPIFNQILKILPREDFNKLVHKHKSDRYYKTFFSWDHLLTMLFGIFSRCDSMGELCDCMRAMSGKLNFSGMDSAPSKSTAGDALRDRSSDLFEDYYHVLLDYFHPILSVSRSKKHKKEKVSFEEFYAFDSSTVRLFTDVMKGVGRNPKGDGKKKGGLKVHMLTDIHADTPKFVKLSQAKLHDKNFIKYLNLPAGSMVVFDKAYNHYLQFAKWTQQGINFVSRLKSNAKPVFRETVFDKPLEKDAFGVYKEENIHLLYKEDNIEKNLCLRLVHYRDEQKRNYQFITNNSNITADEVATLYECRWTIETTFKKLKQNFQLHFFYSDTENGIKTQVWCTLIAYLLLQVIQTESGSNKAFSTIAALLRIHLISLLDLIWVVTEGRRSYNKKNKRSKSKNKSPAAVQERLF